MASTSPNSFDVLHTAPLSDNDAKRELQTFLKKTHINEGLQKDTLERLQQLYHVLKSVND